MADPARNRRAGPRVLGVWDPLVRLVHWGVVLGVLLNGAVLDEDGTAHEWVGYAVMGLVLTRLLWGLIGTRPARFAAFPPDPAAALRHLAGLRGGVRRVHLSHNPAGALMAYNLWATLLGLCVTGMMMSSRIWHDAEWVEEFHEALYGWLVFSVVLHVAGVLFDSWRSGVPLVRAMIDGRKRIPAGKDVQ